MSASSVLAVVKTLIERLANAAVALTGAELRKQLDERPVRFRLEVEGIETHEGKTVISGTFAPDFPDVGPRQNNESQETDRKR